MNDGERRSRWRSHQAQEKGMWVDIHLPSAMPIKRITLYYDYYPYDNAHAINILATTDDGWKTVLAPVPFEMQPFEFNNGHPVYGSQFQTIRFDPVLTETLRIEIEEPHEGRDWTIGEIQVYVDPRNSGVSG